MSDCGWVIIAVNSGDVDYIANANTLRRSLHRVMPGARVTLLTNVDYSDSHYDHVIRIDNRDTHSWALSNDAQIWHYSPYNRTIKLEADMYIPRNIDWWWVALEHRDMHVCTHIRDYRGNLSDGGIYRRTFAENALPQTYNAITYYRRSQLAEDFFTLVADIFTNWDDWRTLLRYSSEDRATTDVVYAIATRILGENQITIPGLTDISMTHMKPWINGLSTAHWCDGLTYEIHPHTFRIATYAQLYPIHYWVKDFAHTIDSELSRYEH